MMDKEEQFDIDQIKYIVSCCNLTERQRGKKYFEIKQKYNYTQEQLAKLMGKHWKTISREIRLYKALLSKNGILLPEEREQFEKLSERVQGKILDLDYNKRNIFYNYYEKFKWNEQLLLITALKSNSMDVMIDSIKREYTKKVSLCNKIREDLTK